MKRTLAALLPVVFLYLLIVGYVVYSTDLKEKSPVLDAPVAVVPIVQDQQSPPASLLDAQSKGQPPPPPPNSQLGLSPESMALPPTSSLQTVSANSTPTPVLSSPLTEATPVSTAVETPGKNPGASINPVDKGKTIETDAFRFRLLDVRSDSYEYRGQNSSEQVNVYVYKLEIENLMRSEYAFSGSEFTVRTGPPGGTPPSSPFSFDFTYPAERIGPNLATDAASIKPGEKLIGYYVESIKKDSPAPPQWHMSIFNTGYNKATGRLEPPSALTEAGAFIVR